MLKMIREVENLSCKTAADANIGHSEISTGQMVNISWRSIPMEHVRLHPLFSQLPDPSEVHIVSHQDLGLFRQDSWQWDALHQGRLTTSKLASVLAFFEHKSSTSLRIPKSLQGHGRVMSAWQHLCQKPPIRFDHLQQNVTTQYAGNLEEDTFTKESPWVCENVTSVFPFQYVPPMNLKQQSSMRIRDPSEARLLWGSVQEATALVSVINFMAKNDSTARVKEAGMLMFEALPEIVGIPLNYQESRNTNVYHDAFHLMYHEQSLPLLGASPDGIIEYTDGRIEIVEIKCHSPFIFNKNKSLSGDFAVTYARHPDSAIPVWHIPQIMMEMFCAGSCCHSALVIIFYVDGCKIFRLARDDTYIAEMLYFISEYYRGNHKRPRNKLRPPEPNFFQPQGNARYSNFLTRSLEISQQAVLIHELQGSEVQRSPFNTQLFFD